VGVNTSDAHGRTPLMEAAAHGHTAVVEALLGHAADVRARDRYGDNALLLAVRGGHPILVDRLLAAGADTNAADANGNTPLMVAAIKGHQAIAVRLMAARGDLHAKNKSGQTAAVLANRNQHQPIVAMLLAHGAKLAEPKDEDSKVPPINLDALRDPSPTVSADRGEESRPYQGWSPLMIAAWRGQTPVVRELVKQRVSVNVRDAEGHTPLSRAGFARGRGRPEFGAARR
jgi:ankyrin repeat protein